MSSKQGDLLSTRLSYEHKNHGKTEDELKFIYSKDGRAVSEV